MSEITPDQDPSSGYDAGTDPDADPESMNPREGGQATGSSEGDPDADPEMMNPRAD